MAHSISKAGRLGMYIVGKISQKGLNFDYIHNKLKGLLQISSYLYKMPAASMILLQGALRAMHYLKSITKRTNYLYAISTCVRTNTF